MARRDIFEIPARPRPARSIPCLEETMHVHVLQHVAFEGIGSMAGWLAALGTIGSVIAGVIKFLQKINQIKWDKQGMTDSWLIPIEYACKTETGETIELVFHIIAINCNCGTDFVGAQTQINLASDDSLKLQAMRDEVYDLKKAFFSQREQKKVIIRLSFDGNLAFPKIQTSLDYKQKNLTADILRQGCQKIMDHFS
ncbi:MAG: hypothetical protein EOM66_10825, partial [Clostridia bacterium]|nr:hypothetical protein [Clostridia bacterium]